MAITTKVGDKGKTAILFGHMVDKAHPLLDISGTVDELNASLGIARASVHAPGLKQDILSNSSVKNLPLGIRCLYKL